MMMIAWMNSGFKGKGLDREALFNCAGSLERGDVNMENKISIQGETRCAIDLWPIRILPACWAA